MPRPCLRLLPVLVLGACGSLAAPPAQASPDPDDPPPLTPIRDPAPVEPLPQQVVLARATPPRPGPGHPPAASPQVASPRGNGAHTFCADAGLPRGPAG